MADNSQTTPRQLHITQDEANRAATLLLLHRDPGMEHVIKCLRALSAGAIKAIQVDELEGVSWDHFGKENAP